jgi:WD40 repeat protein
MADLRTGALETFQLHASPVAALKYDISGRFFVSGASENAVSFVNAQIHATPEVAGDVFKDYDEAPSGRGVLDIAVSNQTIAVCGHSANIRVWHTSDPKSFYL